MIVFLQGLNCWHKAGRHPSWLSLSLRKPRLIKRTVFDSDFDPRQQSRCFVDFFLFYFKLWTSLSLTVNRSAGFPIKSHQLAQNVDTMSLLMYWCNLNVACPFFLNYKFEMFKVCLWFHFVEAFWFPFLLETISHWCLNLIFRCYHEPSFLVCLDF